MAKKKIYRKINNVKLVKALRNENNQLKSKLQQRKEARQKYLVGTYRAINKAAKKWVNAKILDEVTDIYYEILRRFHEVNTDDLYDLVLTHYDMYIAGSHHKKDYRYTLASYIEARGKVLKAIEEKTLTKEQEEDLKEFLIDRIRENSFYVDVDHNIQPALFIAEVNYLGI